MSKKKSKIAKQLTEDLRKMLEKADPIKERVTFVRQGGIHGKFGKTKNREDRRKTKENLKKGDYDG